MKQLPGHTESCFRSHSQALNTAWGFLMVFVSLCFMIRPSVSMAVDTTFIFLQSLQNEPCRGTSNTLAGKHNPEISSAADG